MLDDLGNQHAAEALYRAVLAVDPDRTVAVDTTYIDAAYNLALLLHGKNAAFDDPLKGAGREAATLYQAVVRADPSRWDAWANLGAAAAELKNVPLLATRSYQRAIVELERRHAKSDDEPDDDEIDYIAKLYYGLGMQLWSLTAEQCATFAAEPDSLLMGGTDGEGASDGTSAAVCLENAQNALRTTLQLDPSHAQAEHMLAAMAANAGKDGAVGVNKASAAFVKALFDDFSDTFDSQLASLDYQVPRLLGDTVGRLVHAARAGRPFATALDAGCGTGLAGPYLRPLVSGWMAGVDLSPKMLERARGLTTPAGAAVYDALLDRDLLQLRRTDVLPPADVATGVELVTAADVLVYFGDLRELMEAFAALTSPSAVLVFSCERATSEEAPDGWRLRASGRFAHTKAYVLDEAARAGGFSLVSYEEIVPRTEYGKPVQGHLFALARG